MSQTDIEPEDIVDDMRVLSTNVWFKVVEEREYIHGEDEPALTHGPNFSTRAEAEEYVRDNEDVTEEDIEECRLGEGLREFTNSVNEPLRYIGQQLDVVEDATIDDKRALVEAINSTYTLLDELERALTGDLERVEHPMLQHGERDNSYRCHTTTTERMRADDD